MNSKEEISLLDIFKKLYKDFPQGQIIKRESPDFIIESSDGMIGLEITEIFQDSHTGKSKLQQYSSDSAQFTDQLIAEIQPFVGFTFSVGIHFNKFKPIKKVNRISLINIVKRMCVSILSTLDNKQHAQLDYKDDLPEEIDRLYLSRYDNMKASFNSQPEGGPVANLTINHIIPIIKKKESKLNDYYQCNENWLLIREGNYYAGTFDEIYLTLPIESIFDKIFLMRTNKDKIIQLK